MKLQRYGLQQTGRLLHSFTLVPSATEEQLSLSSVFFKYDRNPETADMCGPHLVSSWQVAELRLLLDAMLTETSVRKVRLMTHARSFAAVDEPGRLCEAFSDMGSTLQIA